MSMMTIDANGNFFDGSKTSEKIRRRLREIRDREKDRYAPNNILYM
tara:strand:+ start:1195 stop:1332 length:138 start_codon:yes stop_codon:yes gene_type:complete